MNKSPILEILPELKSALKTSPVVILEAPAGAGKSTVLPTHLLNEPWLGGKKIIMLQPRRLAARAVASRLADNLGEQLGQKVGMHIRFERQVSKQTKIEVVTEGILTRRLQSDPELSEVGMVILDEFHERSLNADLALALLKEVQGALRDDLRVLIMSATLSPTLAKQLKAPVISSEGRSYPVDIHYLATDPDPLGRIEDAVAACVRKALSENEGDVLVFLPGAREIRETALRLSSLSGINVLPLYGELSFTEQQKAIVPDPHGIRKVVLASSIAETSLTIDGIKVVIDSGLSRTQVYDPSSGLSRMQTSRLTQDAATQRSGRAGRTSQGVAYRLWSRATHDLLAASRKPEILEADLSSLCLEVAAWGSSAEDLFWLDPPPRSRISSAKTLLGSLGAIKENRITEHGRKLLTMPTHPRVGHMLAAAADQALAADLAAILDERDPLPASSGADITDRVSALRMWRSKGSASNCETATLKRVEKIANHWHKTLGITPLLDAPGPYEIGALIATAYPERVALSREGESSGRFLLAGGQGAVVSGELAHAKALAVAQLNASSQEARIQLAAPLGTDFLESKASWIKSVVWNGRQGVLVAQEELKLGAISLKTRPLKEIDSELRLSVLAGAIRSEGLHLLSFSKEAEQFRQRVESLRHWNGEPWVNMSKQALLDSLETWLAGQTDSVRSRDDLARIDLLAALRAVLPWSAARQLEELAPSRIQVPSGSQVLLEYKAGENPVLAVKLQELFGLADTPTVNGGKVPVILHMLSPAGRPIQITSDLRSFWNSSYFEVRRDMRGRYPKHPWPDDPWTHKPTKLVKRLLKS